MADYKEAREWAEKELEKQRLRKRDAGIHKISDLEKTNRGWPYEGVDSYEQADGDCKTGLDVLKDFAEPKAKDFVDPQKVAIGGYKADEGKLRYDLFPPDALDAVAGVYTMGANKYSDRNWEVGMKYGRVFAAMMRHAWKWMAGQTYDEVDGQHHLASVAWCALALLHFDLNKQRYKQYDDRPESTLKDNDEKVVEIGQNES